MRCPNCQTLNPNNAKFCLECGNRLVVCPNCGTVNLPMAKFCIECGTPLAAKTGPTTSGSTPAVQPAQLAHSASPTTSSGATQPLSLPQLLTPPEERRVVTIMFADITGSTPLADRLDPEDMRAILTGYFNLMTEQIRKHGGTVEKYIGDAVMAVFGIPLAHEDDPDRAIRAALDMQVALNQFNELRQAQDPEATRLQMRIGINTGEVATPSNAYRRHDFLITGDAVNIAARLQQVANPETILVGERTYLSARELFDFRAIAPLHVKGKPEPIAARVVLGLRQQTSIITQHPRGIDGRRAPLVGRMLELTLLHANYARVQAERRPHLITILGLPGIGKSRLVREFIAREQERLKSASSAGPLVSPKILYGRCPPYGESITYWPLIEILRSLLGVIEDESDDALQKRFLEFVRTTLARARRPEPPEEIASGILRRIGRSLSNTANTTDATPLKHEPPLSSPGANMKPSKSTPQVAREWRVLFEALAELQPLIIVVDDLQWADEALLDLLEYLTDRISNEPILFLCPVRPDFFERRRDWGGGKRNFTTIELESLSREESSDLVDALLNSTDLPEVLRNTILTRAEGNPFFVEEIVRMFIDQGLLVCEENQDCTTESWRVGPHSELLSTLTTPAELPEDSLLNRHYLLPLPRVPDTVQGVLAARVDLLNPIDKLVLQHAAIVGRTFWLSSVLELATDLGADTVLASLVSLIQRGFITESEQPTRSPLEQDRVFTFKHILIRDVVYNNIPRMRRSQAHARLALWLEEKTAQQQDDFIELLAYHYQQALIHWSVGISLNILEVNHSQDKPVYLTRPELRSRAIKYLTLAGDQALHGYYTVRAIQAYNDAFDLLVDSEADSLTRSKMHTKLGDAYAQRGSMDEAMQEYRRALRLVKEEEATLTDEELLALYERLAVLTTRWLGHFDTLPDPQEIRAYIDAGLELLAGQPISRQRVAFLTYQAFWYIRQLEGATYARKAELAEQALTSGQEALGLAEELNDPSTLSLVLDAIGFIYGEYHKYNEAHSAQHRRQQLESQLTDREELYDLYFSLGVAHEQVADYPNALKWFGQAWDKAQKMENPIMVLASMTKRMRTWRQWNRWDNAWQVALDILQLIEQYQQDEKQQRWALETLATIAYRTGNDEEGDQYARQFKRLLDQQAERSGEETRPLQATRMHAIHLARQDWELATTDYQEKLRSSEPMPSPEVLATLAELLVITGKSHEEQTTICQRAITAAEESGARKSLAIALRARGCMYTDQHNWQQAEDDLRQALQICELLDLPWERGNTLYSLGIHYQRRASSHTTDEPDKRSADLGRARYHFEQALGFFESLKAAPSAQRVRLAQQQDTIARV